MVSRRCRDPILTGAPRVAKEGAAGDKLLRRAVSVAALPRRGATLQRPTRAPRGIEIDLRTVVANVPHALEAPERGREAEERRREQRLDAVRLPAESLAAVPRDVREHDGTALEERVRVVHHSEGGGGDGVRHDAVESPALARQLVHIAPQHGKGAAALTRALFAGERDVAQQPPPYRGALLTTLQRQRGHDRGHDSERGRCRGKAAAALASVVAARTVAAAAAAAARSTALAVAVGRRRRRLGLDRLSGGLRRSDG